MRVEDAPQGISLQSPTSFTRRGFLKALLPTALAVPVLAEELLHPGRVFFLPPHRLSWDVYGAPIGNWEDQIIQPIAEEMAAAVDANVWSVNSLVGGYFYARQLSNVLRMYVQPLMRFRQFDEP